MSESLISFFAIYLSISNSFNTKLSLILRAEFGTGLQHANSDLQVHICRMTKKN